MIPDVMGKPEEEQIEQHHTECPPHHGLAALKEIELQHAPEACHIKLFHFTNPFVTALNNNSKFTCVSACPSRRRAITALPCSVGSA